MKILQVFDSFNRQKNGTVSSLRRLCTSLTQNGHEVTLYTSDANLDRELIESVPQIKVYPFHCLLSRAGFYFTPAMIKETRKHLRDFDVMHLHCFRSFMNIVVYSYARKYGVPYIVDAHGSTPRVVQGKRGVKWLLKWLFDITFGYRILRGAGRVVAETEVGISEYRELGVELGKIVLVPSLPFDVEEFSQLPPPGHFRGKYDIKDRQIVMFLGRIHWIKGLDFLVESFCELAQSKAGVILAIVGPDDGYKPTLDKLIDSLGLSDKVLFTGFLGGEEKLAALVDADVVVQTSVHEQGAGAPLEAVMCNTPIIVSRNTGSGEDVKRMDAGYLVEYGDKSGLRDTIRYVFDNPAEAQIKTQKAKEYIIGNLSWQKQVGNYEKLYNEVIEEV